ncbi:MAG: hypothetical protein JWM34_2147 [Ilumatobacteraceae bacterium]|nr:hypothetical protein [Ilumatobacteraceae bacterium]
MADLNDIRRIGRALPDVSEGEDGYSLAVAVASGKTKSLCWVWKERFDPKKARVPNTSVLAIRTSSVAEKEMLIAAAPATFHTEAHYNGYPAVLVHLSRIDADELEELLIDAWRCLAPKRLVKQYDLDQARDAQPND